MSPLSLSLSVSRPGDDWYLCRLTLATPSQADLQWSMFPVPYLGAVGPDAGPGTVVYRLSVRQRDGSQGHAQFLLVDSECQFICRVHRSCQTKAQPHVKCKILTHLHMFNICSCVTAKNLRRPLVFPHPLTPVLTPDL